ACAPRFDTTATIGSSPRTETIAALSPTLIGSSARAARRAAPAGGTWAISRTRGATKTAIKIKAFAQWPVVANFRWTRANLQPAQPVKRAYVLPRCVAQG